MQSREAGEHTRAVSVSKWQDHKRSSAARSIAGGASLRLAGVALVLLLGVCITAQQPAVSGEKAARAEDAEIVQALRGGQNQTALTLAQHALTGRPADCKVLSLQAMAHVGLGQTDAAAASFQNALTHCPTYLPALEGAAQIAYARKDPAAAPVLERIVAAQPQNQTAHAMLASLLRSTDCAGALPHFAASQGLFASRPELQQEYAFCLAQTGAYAEALVQDQQLAAAHPNEAATYDVALLQWKTKATAAALATLEPLLKAVHFEPAFSLASKLCEELHDTPRAVTLLRTAIALSPDDQENYLAFSGLAYDHNSFPVGIEMLNAGLRRLPHAASLYLARGVLEVQLSQTDMALSDFETAHRLDAQLSFAEDAMGLMLTQQHQDAAALARFQAEVKQHPEDAFLQYLLAEQLSQSTQDANGTALAAAIAAAEASTTLDPIYQPAQDLLTLLYMRAKQPALAIERAERSLAQNPNDEAALYQELLARRRLGQTQSLESLTARLVAAKRENAAKQQAVTRYRLLGAEDR